MRLFYETKMPTIWQKSYLTFSNQSSVYIRQLTLIASFKCGIPFPFPSISTLRMTYVHVLSWPSKFWKLRNLSRVWHFLTLIRLSLRLIAKSKWKKRIKWINLTELEIGDDADRRAGRKWIHLGMNKRCAISGRNQQTEVNLWIMKHCWDLRYRRELNGHPYGCQVWRELASPLFSTTHPVNYSNVFSLQSRQSNNR